MFKILTLLFLSFLSTPADQQPDPIVVEGRTMGTSYRILYFDEPRRRDFSDAIDSLMTLVNKAINTYDPASEISRFNSSKRGVRFKSPYLREILHFAKKVNSASGGAFDPTVMPLVNAWGFGPEKLKAPTPQQVDSLRELVGFDKIRVTKRKLKKTVQHVQLDMGGIGQGYGADIMFRFLRSKGIEHMLVELGGEGIASGKNLKKNHDWTIGILNPNSTQEHQFFKAYVTLVDRAFTTSGNYFNYRIVDGRKFGHTIDPASGYPVQHSLLSASVFAPDCTTADAWATAFMVMGTEKAIVKIKSMENLDALFLYSDDNGELRTYVTPGIEKQIILE